MRPVAVALFVRKGSEALSGLKLRVDRPIKSQEHKMDSDDISSGTEAVTSTLSEEQETEKKALLLFRPKALLARLV